VVIDAERRLNLHAQRFRFVEERAMLLNALQESVRFRSQPRIRLSRRSLERHRRAYGIENGLRFADMSGGARSLLTLAILPATHTAPAQPPQSAADADPQRRRADEWPDLFHRPPAP
jgi:hypothetical protein